MSEARMAHQMRLGTQKMQRKAQHPQGNYDHDEFQFGLVVGQNTISGGPGAPISVDLYLDASQHADGTDTFNPAYITPSVPFLASYNPTGAAPPRGNPGPVQAPVVNPIYPQSSPPNGAASWTYILTYGNGSLPSATSGLVVNGDPLASNELDTTYYNVVSWQSPQLPGENYYYLARSLNGGRFYIVAELVVITGSLTAAAAAGSTSISDNTGVNNPPVVGQYLTVGSGATTEEHVIKAVTGSSSDWTITLTSPLLYDQPSGATVQLESKFLDDVAAPSLIPLQDSITVTVNGTAGTTDYWYLVTSLNQVGESEASIPTQIITGNATLSSTDYNALNWTGVQGATSYNVYRSLNGVTYALIARGVTTNSYSDAGAAPIEAAALPRAVNNTGDVVLVYRGKGRKRSSRMVIGKQSASATPSGIPLGSYLGNMWVSGPNAMFGGVGVPPSSLGQAGDYYFRTDTPGTAGQRLYVNVSGTWTATTL